MDSTMEMERMYMGTDGDMRILMFAYDLVGDPRRDFSAYILFRAKWKSGDTLPTYEKLAEEIRYRDTDIPFWRGGAVYQSKYHSTTYFIVREGLEMSNMNVIIYDISKGIFEEKFKFRFDNAFPVVLNRSLDGDKYEDWMIYNAPNNRFVFYSGGETLDSIPISTYNPPCEGNISGLQIIGDVNSDRVNDIAVFLLSSVAPNCLRIAISAKSSTGVPESSDVQRTIFTLTDPIPHPISRSKSAILTTNITKQGTYLLELLDSSGKQVAELNKQFFEAGSQSIEFDISRLSIASGSYIVRLKNETGMILGQRTIIIE
jgi:hypothetical protein